MVQGLRSSWFNDPLTKTRHSSASSANQCQPETLRWTEMIRSAVVLLANISFKCYITQVLFYSMSDSKTNVISYKEQKIRHNTEEAYQ